jgi:hypothetical protein
VCSLVCRYGCGYGELQFASIWKFWLCLLLQFAALEYVIMSADEYVTEFVGGCGNIYVIALDVMCL